MLKTICVCDRCGKEIEAKLAKRIVIEPVALSEETPSSKLVDAIRKTFKTPAADFCPECVEEIKAFIHSKGGR